MKYLIILVISFITLIACDKDNTDNKEDTIIGKWQLIEVEVIDINFDIYWVTVENSDDRYTITIDNNGNFCLFYIRLLQKHSLLYQKQEYQFGSYLRQIQISQIQVRKWFSDCFPLILEFPFQVEMAFP